MFYDLLSNALSEILSRDVEYFGRFPMRVASLRSQLERYEAMALFRGWLSPRAMEAMTDGLQYLKRQGAVVIETDADNDALGQMMLDSTMDALAAAENRLSLRPCPQLRIPLAEVLSSLYDMHSPRGGPRYFIRRTGTVPLVLVNAVGLPLEIWSRFLGDSTHPFRILVVESRCSDLVRGGMVGDADLSDDSAGIAAALERESLERADVVAWCNGGRVAIDLATRFASRVRSLILLSTTMMGFQGLDMKCSSFEEILNTVFQSVSRRSALASFFAEILRPDPALYWRGIADDGVSPAATLYRLPAGEQLHALYAPVSQGDSLIKYGRRAHSDASYPINEALRRLEQPTLLITGDHDDIVNNQLTIAALEKSGRSFVHAA